LFGEGQVIEHGLAGEIGLPAIDCLQHGPMARESAIQSRLGDLWWSSEILPLLWVVTFPTDPTYMGYENSVDHRS
jgi:hypothetical protein